MGSRMPRGRSSVCEAAPAHTTTASKQRISGSPFTQIPVGWLDKRVTWALKTNCTPAPCMPWRSICANSRQLPDTAWGSNTALCSGASGERPGSTWRAASASMSCTAVPASRIQSSSGWYCARCLAVRKNSSRPVLASKSSSWRAAIACVRSRLYRARLSRVDRGVWLRRQRHSQASSCSPAPWARRMPVCVCQGRCAVGLGLPARVQGVVR